MQSNETLTPAQQSALQASLYCQMITGQENPAINILLMPDAGAPKGSPPRSYFGYADKLLLTAYEMNHQGYTPHLLLQETEGETARKKDITACRVWVLDIDTPVSEDELIRICTRLRPSFVVQSSPGKYHLYYLGVAGERFAAFTGAKQPDQRYYKWVEVAKALIAVAHGTGFDVDFNYTQITKRCRIPGFQRVTKDGLTYTPTIIWASGTGDTHSVTRYSYNQMVALIEGASSDTPVTFSEAIAQYDSIKRKRRSALREASRAQVRARIQADAGSSSVPDVLATAAAGSGIFDFSQITSALDLTNEELVSRSYPAADVGSRNETLFSFMYHVCLFADTLFSHPDTNLSYSFDELMVILGRIASACNENHAQPLEESEVDSIVDSAFEYALRTIEERQAKKEQIRETASASLPDPVPAVDSAEYTPGDRGEAGVGATAGKAFPYDYTRIDLSAPFSDMAMADRMLQRFGDVILRIGDSDLIAVFTGKKWSAGRAHKEVSLNSMYFKILEDVPYEPCFAPFVSDAEGRPARAKIERLVESLYSDYRFKRITSCLLRAPGMRTLASEEFVEKPYILNCVNGAIDLKTRKFTDHRPEYLCKAVAGVAHDPEAKAPTWEDYLQSVFGQGAQGDKLRDYVQRLCGYLISGHMDEQIMVLLYGQGSNGKSVLTQTLYQLLGEYAGVGDESDFGAGKKGGIGQGKLSERVMAKFVGKRLVLGSEFSKDTRLKEEAVKRITGQDTTTARFLYGEAFEVVPTFKMVVGTNHLPHVEDDSIALWRRVHIVPFMFSFFSAEEQLRYKDRVAAESMRLKVSGLNDLLKAELAGILNWCIEGYQMWLQRGLTDQPEVMQDELASAQFDNNMAQEIMARCIVELDQDEVGVGMTPTDIATSIKREIAQATGQAAQEIDISARKIGVYLKRVRRLKKITTRLDDGRIIKLYRVALDFSKAPMLDN